MTPPNLELAQRQGLALAILDDNLARAGRAEGVPLVATSKLNRKRVLRMAVTRRRVSIGLTALAAAAGGLGMRSAQARYYDGPVSDHFDGTRFFDVHGSSPKSRLDLLRWRFGGERAKWPQWAPSPHRDRPPVRVDGRRWRISYVGHATLLLQTAGLNVLIDPMWSERASPVSFAGPRRVNDPGIAFDALPPIDVALVSHNHYDHLDLATLSALSTPHRARVITPLGNDTIMREHDTSIAVEGFDWYQQVVLGRGVAVTLLPVRHWSARGLMDRNKALWAAFVIDTPGGRIFHVADSGYGDGHHFRAARERYGPFRLAVLPIGAYEPRWFMRDQHMNPEESVRAYRDSGAELALGHHYGTFQLTDEAIDAPLAALAVARKQANLTGEQFRALQPGEVWELEG
jgi:L-ascorbate metabolism protein UlaG (beta-lactamase superfamily)